MNIFLLAMLSQSPSGDIGTNCLKIINLPLNIKYFIVLGQMQEAWTLGGLCLRQESLDH